MTASRAGLAVLTMIALLLGVAVALDRPPAAVARSTRILPGFDPERVDRLTVAHAGAARIVVTRDDRGWRVAEPAPGAADPAAIADLLGALELATAARWVPLGDAERAGAALETPQLVVTAEGQGGAHWQLAVGAGAPTGQTWVRRPEQDRAALTDAWVARALDRELAALRRAALVQTTRPDGIEVHAGGVDLLLSGLPLMMHLPEGKARLDRDRATALFDALAALRLVVLPASAPGDVLGTVRVRGGVAPEEIDDLGPCPGTPGHRWVGGTAGAGCVADDGWARVIEQARAIASAPLAAVDARPIAGDRVARVELGDAVIEARGGDWALSVGGEARAADDGAIRALIDGLRTSGAVVAVASEAGAAATTVRVVHTDGSVDELGVIATADGLALRRSGEPFAIVVAPSLVAALGEGAGAVVDTLVLVEEQWALRRLAARDGAIETVVERGASLERWVAVVPAGSIAELGAISAIRGLTAGLRADTVGGPMVAAPVRTLLLEFDPPPTADPGEGVVYTVVVGAPQRDGRCRVMVDDEPAILPVAACSALLAPLVSPP